MKKAGFWIIVLLLCLAGAFYYFRNDAFVAPPSENTVTNPGSKPEVQGTVTFLGGDNPKTIDVEVARSAYEHSKGLMDRTSMPHNQGMLFIFDDMSPRSFWMRNTRISLDIIFVDDQYKVVSIQKNAVPMSEESLLSERPAKYVVEVNAGFSDLYNIRPGDSLSFRIP